jgi:hypothetical protein
VTYDNKVYATILNRCFYNLFNCGINIEIWSRKIKMLIAVKDNLKIEITVFGQEVKIEMPEMNDVIILWSNWIKQEEDLAETFLKSQYIQNPYPALKDYFEDKGWEVKN